LLGFLGTHKGLVHVTLGNLVGAVITGGFFLLLASIQQPEEYGRTNYEIALASLAASAALLGLNTAATTYLAKGSSEKMTVQLNQVVLLSSFVAAVIVAILRGWMSGLFVLGMAFWMMGLYEALGRKSYKQYAILNIGARASQLVLSVVLFYTMGVLGVVLGFAISFLVFAYPYFRTIRHFDYRSHGEVKSAIKFASHSYSFNMASAFFQYLDKLIIAPVFGLAVLGYYQIGFQFLMFLGMIPVSFYQYLLPEQSAGSKRTGSVHILGFALSIGLAALLFVASPWILRNLFPNFVDALVPVRIMSIGIVPMMIVWNLNSKFMAVGYTRYVLYGSAIYLALQITLMMQLGGLYGAAGIAIASVISLATQAGFLYAMLRHSSLKL
jgi:O-antigen/teichoic acid export membrane protein